MAKKSKSEELLFKEYLKMQSKEFKEDLIGYESFKQPGKDGSIEWY